NPGWVSCTAPGAISASASAPPPWIAAARPRPFPSSIERGARIERCTMRKWIVPFVALLAFAGAHPIAAVVCTLDRVPAATLLLPYFEVDLDRPNGRTTLMSVVNASGQPRLAHVVLWTDLGVPTLTLDLFLTGYDVQTLNLRDLFAGRLPQTADAAR